MRKRERVLFALFILLTGIFCLISSINYGEIIDTQLELQKQTRQNQVMIRAILGMSHPFSGVPNRMVNYE